MIDKIKKIFLNKDKKMENLVSFLIILVVTLIIINKVLDTSDNNEIDYENKVGVELASVNLDSDYDNSLEKKLENILSKINGVGNVSVLITYSESEKIIPVYNINTSQSKTEENDDSGTVKKTETLNEEKEVLKDSNSQMVTEKIIMPTVEGAIIIAKGASNSVIKSNIISAVEAVTGIATHKIQVYEMGDD